MNKTPGSTLLPIPVPYYIVYSEARGTLNRNFGKWFSAKFIQL